MLKAWLAFLKTPLVTIMVLLLIGCPAGDQSDFSAKQVDPLLAYAWHLSNTGQKTFAKTSGKKGADANVLLAHSNGFTGKGIRVAIHDTGVDHQHEDLYSGYVREGSKDFTQQQPPYDGHPRLIDDKSKDAHGTAVTGIIASGMNNGVGSRGVAPDANWMASNYLYSLQDTQRFLLQFPTNQYNIDLYNLSYGRPTCRPYKIGSNDASRRARINAIKEVSEMGRGGKGALLFKAAGNEGVHFYSEYNACKEILPSNWQFRIFMGNAALDEMNNLFPMTVVGAHDAEGDRVFYSNPGPNVLVVGPAGHFGKEKPAILTTDLSGCSSGMATHTSQANSFENNANSLNLSCKYTSIMNGTSAAAPAVAGVAALILQANPSLSNREVNALLIKHAKHPPDLPVVQAKHLFKQRDLPSGFIFQPGPVTNSQGHIYSPDFGFGLVDAWASVQGAQTRNSGWLGPLVDTINPNDDSPLYSSETSPSTIQDFSNSGTTSAINVHHNITIEALTITPDFTHSVSIEEIALELRSPSGTTIRALNGGSGALGQEMRDFQIKMVGFWKEPSKGTWTLIAKDVIHQSGDGSTGNDGTFNGWAINFYGHRPKRPANISPPLPVSSLIISSSTDSSTSKTPTFTWNPPAEDPTHRSTLLRYEYSIEEKASKANIRKWVSNGKQTSLQVTGLTLIANTTYSLHVRAVGEYEDFSSVQTQDWTAPPP